MGRADTERDPERGSDPEPNGLSDTELFGVNAAVVEEIRESYLLDPTSVDQRWSDHFAGRSVSGNGNGNGSGNGTGNGSGGGHALLAGASPAAEPFNLQISDKHARVLRLIHTYRARGHRIAASDPLGEEAPYFPELDPAHYGFGHEDMNMPLTAGDLPGGSVQTLQQILDRLSATYCGSIGVEYTHVQDPGRKQWLQQRMEEGQPPAHLHAL